MLPYLLGLGALLYFLSTRDRATSTLSPIEAKRFETAAKRAVDRSDSARELERKKDRFIAENPDSLAALQVTDPEEAARRLAEAQAYTDSKIATFRGLSPEERRNYKGGF